MPTYDTRCRHYAARAMIHVFVKMPRYALPCRYAARGALAATRYIDIRRHALPRA